MTGLFSMALIWGLAIWAFLRARLGLAVTTWFREILYRPKEALSSEQLFGCLLSANFALLLHDNFNQVASALPKPRIRKVLAEHWGIVSRSHCLRLVDDHMERLGEQCSSDPCAALEDTCTTMTLRARLARVDKLRHSHLSVLAWDIQQLAYLIRLARAVDQVSQGRAEILLERLAAHARVHFGSWNDYSLSALVGMGMRVSTEIFDTSEWRIFARTHSILLDDQHSPIRHASTWGHEQRNPESAAEMSGAHGAFTSHAK